MSQKSQRTTSIKKNAPASAPVSKVEKGIPIPEKIHDTYQKYPFNNMNVGDSITVDGSLAPSARCSAYTYAKRHGVSFVTRRDGARVRIWRAT